MDRTYKLEIEIVLGDKQQKKAVKVVRRIYAANPARTEDDVREISADESIVWSASCASITFWQ